jgi:hypothetical protein
MKSHDLLNLEGAIYWRSDTRNPLENEKLFENGNTARQPIFEENWWEKSIRFYDYGSTDAIPTNCISVSTNFFSSAIFPIISGNTQGETNESYIYAIALPKAYKINSNQQLDAADLTPKNRQNIVIDLHSYQTEHARLFLEKNSLAYKQNPLGALNAASCLYGYEAMVHHINKKNIICAVKITRSPQQLQLGLPSCSFQINGEVLVNNKFLESQYLFGLDKNNSTVALNINYSNIKKDALIFLQDLKGKLLKTPLPIHGLGGKTFKSPTDVIPITVSPLVVPRNSLSFFNQNNLINDDKDLNNKKLLNKIQ